MPALDLSFDDVLHTTVAVRQRLDLERPVEREVLMELFELANYAPSSRNTQPWHFLIVTEEERKVAAAEIYREVWDEQIRDLYTSAIEAAADNPAEQRMRKRMMESSQFLRDYLHKVPVLLFPCLDGRVENQAALSQSLLWGSVVPTVWSFMLAARSRGLGTSWTSLHLAREKEMASVLGLPFGSVTQAALLPLAYTKGLDFKRPPRRPLEGALHWEQW